MVGPVAAACERSVLVLNPGLRSFGDRERGPGNSDEIGPQVGRMPLVFGSGQVSLECSKRVRDGGVVPLRPPPTWLNPLPRIPT